MDKQVTKIDTTITSWKSHPWMVETKNNKYFTIYCWNASLDYFSYVGACCFLKSTEMTDCDIDSCGNLVLQFANGSMFVFCKE